MDTGGNALAEREVDESRHSLTSFEYRPGSAIPRFQFSCSGDDFRTIGVSFSRFSRMVRAILSNETDFLEREWCSGGRQKRPARIHGKSECRRDLLSRGKGTSR